MSFTNKQVWITGAGRGIGARSAELFQAYGASVVAFDKEFPSSNYSFSTYKMDITDSTQVADICGDLLKDNEGPDVLVNAAGVLRVGGLSDISLQDWQECLAVNVSGPFYLMRELAPHFKARRRGAIVNVASNAGHVPRLAMTAYCASKAALISLSQCVGLELAEYGVRCNLVSPGSTDTQMLRNLWDKAGSVESTIKGSLEQHKLGIPLGKIAKTSDIANTILFLASDMASHISMQDIVVDGGATLGA